METKRIPPRRNRTGRRQARNSRTAGSRTRAERQDLGEAIGRNAEKTLFIALSVHVENQKAKTCIGEDENSKSNV